MKKGVEDQHLSTLWEMGGETSAGRKDNECSKRYQEMLNPQLKKGECTAEEDTQLLQAYEQLGGRWGLVGQQLQRSGLRCHNRPFTLLL